MYTEWKKLFVTGLTALGAVLLLPGCATPDRAPGTEAVHGTEVAVEDVAAPQPEPSMEEPPTDLAAALDSGRVLEVQTAPAADADSELMVPVGRSTARVAEEPGTAPAPHRAAGVVRPGLHLSVAVMVAGRPEIEQTSRQVSAQGTLDLPLIGKVEVAGLGLEAVEALLTERYRAYLVNPQVITQFVQPSGSNISPWGYVTVLGRVKSPGKIAIPATRDLTVSAAIQQAGGLDTSARDSAIRVTRQQDGGSVQRIKVDLKAYAKGRLDEDVVLRAGDVVFVPESAW